MAQKGEMLSKMLVLATNTHAGQFDKSGEPYILHTLKVMHYAMKNISNTDETFMETVRCVAVGHDLIEDSRNHDVPVTPEVLREHGQSEEVIDAIQLLSKPAGKLTPEQFKEYQNGIMTNRVAVIVKMADLRHNSDIRRLKGVTQKDIQRTISYHNFYTRLKEFREKEGF